MIAVSLKLNLIFYLCPKKKIYSLRQAKKMFVISFIINNNYPVQFYLFSSTSSDGTCAVLKQREYVSCRACCRRIILPTSIAFLDDNTLLVLEKEGNVRLVPNGVLQEDSLLQVPVNTVNERGLLGVTVVNGTGNSGSDNATITYFYNILKQNL